MVQDEIKQHKTIGSAFSSAFLMIAVMIVMTTMHRMLRNQRTQIGILKAFGFSRLKLLIHYLSHSGTICFCGALAGCVLGCRVMPGIIYPFMKRNICAAGMGRISSAGLSAAAGYLCPFLYYSQSGHMQKISERKCIRMSLQGGKRKKDGLSA